MPRRKRRSLDELPTPKFAPERCEEAAATGDPFALFDEIMAAPFYELEISEEFPKLQQLVQQASRNDPLGFAKKMLDRGFSTVSYLALRIEFYITRMLGPTDQAFDRQVKAGLQQDIFHELLPRLMEMNQHLAAMAMARATVERQIELARAKRLENELTELLRPGKNCSAARATAKTIKGRANGHRNRNVVDTDELAESVTGNGHAPINRISGLGV